MAYNLQIVKLKKFPFFKQLDAMDCGPASLKIICRHYGRNFSMKYLRDKCQITREGVSLKDLSRVAEHVGLRSLPLKVSFEDLEQKIPLPCIVHWNYSHFVVVYKIRRNKVYVSDPQVGLVRYTKDDFIYAWKKNKEKGIILVLEPGKTFYESEDTSSSGRFSGYLPYLKPHTSFLIQIFFGMLLEQRLLRLQPPSQLLILQLRLITKNVATEEYITTMNAEILSA